MDNSFNVKATITFTRVIHFPWPMSSLRRILRPINGNNVYKYNLWFHVERISEKWYAAVDHQQKKEAGLMFRHHI